MTWAAVNVRAAKRAARPGPMFGPNRWFRVVDPSGWSAAGSGRRNWFGTRPAKRGGCWKHGSICEDWSAKVHGARLFAVSGWGHGLLPLPASPDAETCRVGRRALRPLAPRYSLYRGAGTRDRRPATKELRWLGTWMEGPRDREHGGARRLEALHAGACVHPRGHYAERPGPSGWPSRSGPRSNCHALPAFHLGSGRSSRARARRQLAQHWPIPLGRSGSAGQRASGAAYSRPGEPRRRSSGGEREASASNSPSRPLTEALEFAGDAGVHLKGLVDRPVAQIGRGLLCIRGRRGGVRRGVLRRGQPDPPRQPRDPGGAGCPAVPHGHRQFSDAARCATESRPATGLRLGILRDQLFFPRDLAPAPRGGDGHDHTEGSYLELPLRGVSARTERRAGAVPASRDGAKAGDRERWPRGEIGVTHQRGTR